MAIVIDGGDSGLDDATKLRLMYQLVRVLLMIARQQGPGSAGDLSGFYDMLEGGARLLANDPVPPMPECPS